jgi:replicative superfamily II helicase
MQWKWRQPCAERSGQLYVTELGRVASHFYIRYASILVFNEQLTRHMDEARVRSLPSQLLPNHMYTACRSAQTVTSEYFMKGACVLSLLAYYDARCFGNADAVDDRAIFRV